MRTKNLTRAAVAALLSIPPAMADQTLPTITVVAPSPEKAQFDVPYSTSVVTDKRAINELQSKTLPDAIRYEPGVMIQQTSIGQYSPYIRGLTGYRTLLMVDGIRLNNAVMRDGPNQYWGSVDPLMIESYDLIRGPTTSLYGPDAVGGSLNVTTQSWRPSEDGKNWGGRLFYRFGQADNSNIARLELGGKVGDWDMVFGGSGKQFSNLTTGNGENNPLTNYDQEAMNAKIRYHINNTDMLTFAHQYDTINDAWRTHSTVFRVDFDGTYNNDPKFGRSLNQRRQLSYLRYEGSDLGLMDKLAITFSYQQIAEDQTEVGLLNPYPTLPYLPGDRETNNFHDNTTGFQVRASSDTRIGVLDYGIEYYHDDITSNGKVYNPDGTVAEVKRQGTVADNSTYDNVGLYLQDTYKWGDFEFTGGGRFNYIKLHLGNGYDTATQQNIDNFNNNWSTGVGNGRVLYHIDKNWNIYAGVSQGWRAPTVYDISGEEWARTNEVQAYSLNMKPEQYVTYETGIKTQYHNLEASASYYYNYITNMIVRAPIPDPNNPGQQLRNANGDYMIQGRNSDNGFIQGVELMGRYYFDDNWSSFANFTWTDGSVSGFPTPTFEQFSSPISRMIPINGTAGLRWNSSDRQIWAESTVTAVARQTRLSFNDIADTSRVVPGGTPGYVLWGLRGGWNPIKGLRASVALENLLDEKYRVHGSGINGPGRQVLFTMDYHF